MIDPLSHVIFILAVWLIYRLAGGRSAAELLTLGGIVFVFANAPVAAIWIALTSVEALILFWILAGRPRESAWRKYGAYLLLPNFLFVDLHPLGFGLNLETLAISFSTIRIFMTTKQLLSSRKASSLKDCYWIFVAAFYLPAIVVGPIFSGLDLKKQKLAGPCPLGLKDYRLVLQGMVLAILVNPALGVFETLLGRAIAPVLFLQLFTAFWGQSLIAEHTSRFFGFQLPVNFDAPWKATDIRDFWQRWHRSMAQFVIQYIFLPLNLRGVGPKVATILAFVFMGVWHNLSFGYALWGLGHGLLLSYWPKQRFDQASEFLVRSATWIAVITLSYIANYGLLA